VDISHENAHSLKNLNVATTNLVNYELGLVFKGASPTISVVIQRDARRRENDRNQAPMSINRPIQWNLSLFQEGFLLRSIRDVEK